MPPRRPRSRRPTPESIRRGPVDADQHWFFEQEIADSDHWNQSFVFEVPADVDVDVLEEALHRVVLHHDALRLRYRRIGEVWQQEYGPAPASTPIVRVDLSAVGQPDRGAALTARSTKLQARLSKTEGPLVRAMHFQYGDEEPGRLVLAIHHLAIDGVSWRILIEDLETAYLGLRDGRVVELPPRTTSYKRWSEELTAYATSDACAASLGRWSIVSAGAAGPLPRDHRGAENLEATADEVVVYLDAAETRELSSACPPSTARRSTTRY